MKIQDELRDAARDLRVTPKPLADVIPLLLRAADEIERLEEYQWMYEARMYEALRK